MLSTVWAISRRWQDSNKIPSCSVKITQSVTQIKYLYVVIVTRFGVLQKCLNKRGVAVSGEPCINVPDAIHIPLKSTITAAASCATAASNEGGKTTVGGSGTGGTENEETFSPASGTSADSNSSVTAAMENLSTDPAEQMVTSGMDVDVADKPPTTSSTSGMQNNNILT